MTLLKAWSGMPYPAITIIDNKTIEFDLDRKLKGVRFKRISESGIPEKLRKKIKKR